MESSLSPRDIQARIRMGQSLEEVASAAGVPTERVEAFAAPVLAERAHAAGSAQQAPVRRTGESSSSRSLRAVMSDRLQQRGIDIDDVTWDAWREADRSWTVVARYQSGSAEHEGRFRYDQRARFSVARNDEARWLIGEVTSKHGPQPGRQAARKPSDPDHEPTIDLNDELALVRAVQPGNPSTTGGSRSTTADQDTRSMHEQQSGAGEPDDYAEADLQEVDGVYDIVPQQSELDVLYEMLSSFNEDSVNIYAGLTQPVVDELLQGDQPPTAAEVDDAREEEALQVEAEVDDAREEEALQVEAGVDDADENEAATPGLPPGQPEGLEQDPLIDSILLERSEVHEQAPVVDGPDRNESEPIQAAPPAEQAPAKAATRRPRTPRAKGGRASVPSWDEIMFGGPKDS